MEFPQVLTSHYSQQIQYSAAQCVHPGAPANGDVLVTGLSLGDTATYTCEEGFGLVGEETATCVELDANSAAFSSESPICLGMGIQWNLC